MYLYYQQLNSHPSTKAVLQSVPLLLLSVLNVSFELGLQNGKGGLSSFTPNKKGGGRKMLSHPEGGGGGGGSQNV